MVLHLRLQALLLRAEPLAVRTQVPLALLVLQASRVPPLGLALLLALGQQVQVLQLAQALQQELALG